jgi:hypothetical protein
MVADPRSLRDDLIRGAVFTVIRRQAHFRGASSGTLDNGDWQVRC